MPFRPCSCRSPRASAGSPPTASAARSRCPRCSASARWSALVIIVLVQTAFAFFGHNLVQAFERCSFPVLAVIFASPRWRSSPIARRRRRAVDGGVGGMGGFLLTVGTAFGYAAGWTPYAADYTRYLPASVSTARTGFFAAAGLFLSCVILEVVGAASVTDRARPRWPTTRPGRSPSELASPLAKADPAGHRDRCHRGQRDQHLLRRDGLRDHRDQAAAHVARALVTVFFGVAGFLVAWWALPDAAHSYEAFLLIIAYWIGPWLGVVFADQYLRRGQPIAGFLYDRSYANWGGLLSFADRPRGVGAAVLQPGEVRRRTSPGRCRSSATSRSSSASCSPGPLSRAVPLQDRRRTRPGMTPEEMLDVAVDEARKGPVRGRDPDRCRTVLHRRHAAGQRAQPAGAARRPVGARRDRRVPRRGTSARLPLDDHGDHAVAVLVLQRAGAPVQHRRGGDRREPDVQRWARLAGRARGARSRFSTTSAV